MPSPPLFIENLSPPGRLHFEQRLQRRTWKDKQPILQEGDPCRSILFVEQGALRVFKSAPQGREITLYRVREGELCILSMASVLAQTPYTASVAAAGPTVAWELEAEAFRALHASERTVRELVAGQLHRLLSEVMALVTEVAFQRVDARLASLILLETEARPTLETTHERLAQDLGTAREVVSRLLENLRDDGVLAVERGALRVLDRRALEAIAKTAR